MQPPSYPPGSPYAKNGFSAQQLDAPAPPHSLAPVAMPMTDPSMSFGATSTGMTAPSPPKASMKAGISILVIGAFVGALAGVAMRVHQNGAAEPVSAAAEGEPVPVAVAPGPVATQALPQVPAAAYAANLVPGTVIQNAAPVEASKVASKKGKRTAVAAPAPATHATLAAKVSAPAPAPVKEAKAAPTPAKEAKAPKVEKEPTEKAGKKPSGAESSAAVNALKAAQGETELSLSGGK